jgi:hypothetical protein
MKVLTSYPVIIDKERISPTDFYSSAAGDTGLPEKEYSVGGMTIKTNYPVILDETNVSPADYYSSYTGDQEKSISDLMAKGSNREEAIQILKLGTDTNPAANKGKFWDKVKGAWTNVKNNPAAQYAWQQAGAYIANKGAVGGGGGGGDYTGQQQQQQQEQKPTPMSKTTKIVLIGSGVIVVGLILYAVLSGNKKTATK